MDEKMPSLNAGFWIIFPKKAHKDQIATLLPTQTAFETNCDGDIFTTVLEVRDFYAWDIDDVLTELFAKCKLEEWKAVADQFDGKIHIGLWYYSYDSSPAIIFEGRNMEIIHRLNADISIDPY